MASEFLQPNPLLSETDKAHLEPAGLTARRAPREKAVVGTSGTRTDVGDRRRFEAFTQELIAKDRAQIEIRFARPSVSRVGAGASACGGGSGRVSAERRGMVWATAARGRRPGGPGAVIGAVRRGHPGLKQHALLRLDQGRRRLGGRWRAPTCRRRGEEALDTGLPSVSRRSETMRASPPSHCHWRVRRPGPAALQVERPGPPAGPLRLGRHRPPATPATLVGAFSRHHRAPRRALCACLQALASSGRRPSSRQ